jgi:hypothetical protein
LRDIPIRESGISLVRSFYLVVHLSVILMILLDVTSAAHSVFFAGNFKMPNITLQSKKKMHSIDGTGYFINAPHNRFGLSLQCHKRLMYRNLFDLVS